MITIVNLSEKGSLKTAATEDFPVQARCYFLFESVYTPTKTNFHHMKNSQ